jgi:hypothetical protein
MNSDVTRTADPSTATGDAVNALRDLLTHSAPTAGAVVAAGVPDLPPGFVLEREIGVGGMGVVYLARQQGLNRPVALKLVKDARVDAKALIRFLAEAEAVASIKHPNVVEVYQYGDHHGRPYMALEFCPGGDLTALRNEPEASATGSSRNAAWFRRVADLMAQVADGVNAAHAQGIVHRDLKPHNVFLTADGTPKVADFGLAKRGLGSDLTQTDAVMGTPAYMAPEQAGGGTKFVGPEADVWALGVMLYELCCGERPLDTSGPLLDAIARVARAEVSLLRTKVPTVPPDLALIAHKCLSRDPRDRYPTAGGLAADLRSWLDGKPISARSAGVFEQAVKWAKRNKKLAGMGLAVLLTMATATGVSLGFGLEANKQADIARQKQSDAEDAATREAKEKAEAIFARNELAAERERTNRTLARALLGSMGASRSIHASTQKDITSVLLRSTGTTRTSQQLSEYEKNALWDLASLRRGPVPLMLMQEAAGSPLAAAQFSARAEYLDHAAVGLDSERRRQVDALLARGLKDDEFIDFRRDLVFAAHNAERYGAAEAMVEPLTDGIEHQGGITLSEHVKVMLAVADRLPAEAAEVLLRRVGVRLVRRLALEKGGISKSTDDQQTLMGLTQRLPADTVEELAEELSAALLGSKDRSARATAALILGMVAGRLPTEKAEAVCGPVAEDLLVRPGEGEAQFGAFDINILWSEGLVAMALRLPADRAAEVLTTAMLATAHRNGWPGLALGLAAVSARLTPEKADEVADRLLAGGKKVTDGINPQAMIAGLAAVAQSLSAAKAADVSQVLSAHLGKVTSRAQVQQIEERRRITGGLVEAAARLPAERGAEVLTAALRKATDTADRRAIAVGLARVARRLPAESATAVCGSAAELLLADLRESKSGRESSGLAMGLAAVAALLPASRAEQACGAAADLLITALSKPGADPSREWQYLAEALAALAARVPVGRAEKVCGEAAAVLLATLETNGTALAAVALTIVAEYLPAKQATVMRGASTDALLETWGGIVYGYPLPVEPFATAVSGLRPAGLAHRKSATEFAAITGVSVLHPDIFPKPHPLPPQQLVELLKHPFCVREARRAVLDALELTYDRTFAHLWEFVAFAEKEHPELDLLTPPKRPEKK